MSYECVACEGANPVTVLLTNLANGQTACACDMDAPLMAITFVAGWLEVDAGKLYDVIKRFADKEAKREHQAAASTAQAAGNDQASPDTDGQGDADLDENSVTGDMEPIAAIGNTQGDE